MDGDLIERLTKLLADLDESFQTRGLHFEENLARTLAREMISLHKVYRERYGEDLFYAFSVSEGEELIRTRQRLHDLEGETSTISKLIRAIGEIKEQVDEVREAVEEKVSTDEPTQKERDANL